MTPYGKLPHYHWWRRSVVGKHWAEVDPVISAPFQLNRKQKIATAGSCFAQHIAQHLRAQGFGYFVSESVDDIVPSELARRFGYGVFSARYGNIYTVRQLTQLFGRAFGTFSSVEDVWTDGNRFYDPFRPFIQPAGFSSAQELVADRESHLAAVKELFEKADVFVFTLGLTECWECRADGTVLPSCPGTSGVGTYDPDKYAFRNFSAFEVTDDLRKFVSDLRKINPEVLIILTVSPVPLIATMENRSVIVSTCYSKAALRVAAEEVSKSEKNVAYFPSFEIVTSNFSVSEMFEGDFREVRPEGVEHVMKLFLRHYCSVDSKSTSEHLRILPDSDETGGRGSLSATLVRAICDEEQLEAQIA